MALTSNIKDHDWVSVRQASAKLGSIKLGPTSTPTYKNITLTDLTADSLIYPDSNKLLTSLGVATNGQLPIGSTGATPVLATLTSTANQVNVTNSAGSITLSTPQDIHSGATAFAVTGLAVNTNTLVANVSGYANKVGIGTATPSQLLEVHAVDAPAVLLINSITSNQRAILQFSHDTTLKWDFGTTVGGSDVFRIREGGTTNRLNITPTTGLLSYFGPAVFQPLANSTTTFQWANAAGAVLVNADTTNLRLGIGSNVTAPASTLHIVDGSDTFGTEFIVEDTDMTFSHRPAFFLKNADADRAGFYYYNSNHTIYPNNLFIQVDSGSVVYGCDVGVRIPNPVSTFHVYENTTEATSGAGITIEQDGTGDAVLQFLLTATKRWPMGIDNSDGDKFKLCNSTGLASGAVMVFDGTNLGLGGETAPATLIEITNTEPWITTQNSTHINNLGRISRWIAKGNKLDESEHTLATTEVGHDGTGDDYGGYWKVSTHTKAMAEPDTLVDRIKINELGIFLGDAGVTNYTEIEADGDILQRGTGRFIESSKFKLTSIGGFAVLLTNQTGANTVAGQLVKADTASDDAVILTAAGDVECFGVFLDAGIADGSETWVVVAGIADVAMEDNTAATHGNWVETSDAEAGYADATSATPAAAPAHFEEIGHCIESVAAGGGGTHILARCVLHFN